MASDQSNYMFRKQAEINAYIVIREGIRQAMLKLDVLANVHDDKARTPKTDQERADDALHELNLTFRKLEALGVDVTYHGEGDTEVTAKPA